MSKLDELRAKLRTGELEAELEARREQSNRIYKINPSGSDALIKFGRHRGLTLLQIKQKEPGYLDFIRNSDFPEELKDVVRYIQTITAAKEISLAADSLTDWLKGDKK